jgi:hypothetical protein
MQELQKELREKTRLARLARLNLGLANQRFVDDLNWVRSQVSHRIMSERVSQLQDASNVGELRDSLGHVNRNLMIQLGDLNETSIAFRDAARLSKSHLDLSLRVAEIQEELSIMEAAAEEAEPASLGRLGKRARGN